MEVRSETSKREIDSMKENKEEEEEDLKTTRRVNVNNTLDL